MLFSLLTNLVVDWFDASIWRCLNPSSIFDMASADKMLMVVWLVGCWRSPKRSGAISCSRAWSARQSPRLIVFLPLGKSITMSSPAFSIRFMALSTAEPRMRAQMLSNWGLTFCLHLNTNHCCGLIPSWWQASDSVNFCFSIISAIGSRIALVSFRLTLEVVKTVSILWKWSWNRHFASRKFGKSSWNVLEIDFGGSVVGKELPSPRSSLFWRSISSVGQCNKFLLWFWCCSAWSVGLYTP